MNKRLDTVNSAAHLVRIAASLQQAARRGLLTNLVALLLLGCSGPQVTSPSSLAVPDEQNKCKVAASQESPLVTEWPASDKANLEAGLRTGAVAVAYSGCEMRILPACSGGGNYQWQRTAIATDRIEILDEDDLWAKLPLGAAKLEGQLQTAGRLAITTTVSGQKRLTGVDMARPRLSGECRDATHLVTAMSVGAYEMFSGNNQAVSGSAGTQVTGDVGGGTQSAETSVRRAGSSKLCMESTDEAPHPDCGSPIQVFLSPLPQFLAEQTPKGMHDVQFVSDNSDIVWEVTVGETVLCQTPCIKRIPEYQTLTFREKDPPFLAPAATVDVPDLQEHGMDPVQIRAHKSRTGRLATGIVVTSVSALTMMAGIVLTAVGCRDSQRSSKGACIAGGITLPIGVLGTGGGVYLMMTAGPYTDVIPRPGLKLPVDGQP